MREVANLEMQSHKLKICALSHAISKYNIHNIADLRFFVTLNEKIPVIRLLIFSPLFLHDRKILIVNGGNQMSVIIAARKNCMSHKLH